MTNKLWARAVILVALTSVKSFARETNSVKGTNKISRLSTEIFNLGKVCPYPISIGRLSMIEFPAPVTGFRLGSPQDIEVIKPADQANEIDLVLKNHQARPTNLMVKAGGNNYFFDIIPSNSKNVNPIFQARDFLNIFGTFGGPEEDSGSKKRRVTESSDSANSMDELTVISTQINENHSAAFRNRIAQTDMDLGMVETRIIGVGKISIIETPEPITGFRIGLPQDFEVFTPTDSKNEIDIVLKSSKARPTNLIILCGNKKLHFSLIPNHLLPSKGTEIHQDYVRIRSVFGGVRPNAQKTSMIQVRSFNPEKKIYKYINLGK